MPPDSPGSTSDGDGNGDGGSGDDGGMSSPSTAGEAFEAGLAELEREGALLLVASRTTDRVHRQLCRLMLGTTSGPSRRRLLALTGGEVGSALDRLQTGAGQGPAHLQVVNFDVDTRSGSSAAVGSDASGSATRAPVGTRSPGAASGVPRRVVDGDDGISAFGEAMADAVEDLHPREEFDPQELRVCVDSLDALVDLYDVETVQQFVHILRGMVRSHGGLGHVHFSAPPDHDDVDRIAPLCDAVVEVRESGDRPEYRLEIWNGPTSDWLPLDPGTQ